MNNIGPIYSWFYTDMKGNEMFADLENSHIFIDNLFAMLNGIEKNQYNCHNTSEPKTTNKHNYLSTISCIVFRLFLAGNRPIFLAFILYYAALLLANIAWDVFAKVCLVCCHGIFLKWKMSRGIFRPRDPAIHQKFHTRFVGQCEKKWRITLLP